MGVWPRLVTEETFTETCRTRPTPGDLHLSPSPSGIRHLCDGHPGRPRANVEDENVRVLVVGFAACATLTFLFLSTAPAPAESSTASSPAPNADDAAGSSSSELEEYSDPDSDEESEEEEEEVVEEEEPQEDPLVAAERSKEEGNAHFKAARYGTAIDCYTKANGAPHPFVAVVYVRLTKCSVCATRVRSRPSCYFLSVLLQR